MWPVVGRLARLQAGWRPLATLGPPRPWSGPRHHMARPWSGPCLHTPPHHRPLATSIPRHRSGLLPLPSLHLLPLPSLHHRPLATSTPWRGGGVEDEPPPGVVRRFKQMMKDYWYVLVPVHVATSIVWLGGFYLLLKSGVDMVSFLERLGTSQRILDYLGNSETGYIALSYACYKIATPARYTVTVAGTTLAVAKLKDTGYLKASSELAKDMQSRKENLKEKYDERKDDLKERLEDGRDGMTERLERLERLYRTARRKK